jgi:hypothetical protein
MSYSKRSIKIGDSTVTLEQVTDHNAYGSVYILSADSTEKRWGYGRGHSEAKDILFQNASMEKLAEDFLSLTRS